MCVYIRFFKTYFKKLAYMISESGKSKIYRVGWQAEELGIASIEVQPQRSSAGRLFLLRRGQFFVLFRPSTDRTRPTHIMEDNRLHLKSANLNVNLI